MRTPAWAFLKMSFSSSNPGNRKQKKDFDLLAFFSPPQTDLVHRETEQHLAIDPN